MYAEAVQIGTVTNDGSLKVSVDGKQIIDDAVAELHKLWSEAIPNFVAKQ